MASPLAKDTGGGVFAPVYRDAGGGAVPVYADDPGDCACCDPPDCWPSSPNVGYEDLTVDGSADLCEGCSPEPEPEDIYAAVSTPVDCPTDGCYIMIKFLWNGGACETEYLCFKTGSSPSDPYDQLPSPVGGEFNVTNSGSPCGTITLSFTLIELL